MNCAANIKSLSLSNPAARQHQVDTVIHFGASVNTETHFMICFRRMDFTLIHTKVLECVLLFVARMNQVQDMLVFQQRLSMERVLVTLMMDRCRSLYPMALPK